MNNIDKQKKQILVIGGGAAGMLAAISAAENGAQVTLLEKNEKLGKKIYITGKGRCNVTNAAPIEELFDFCITNKKFLYSAFYGFSNTQMCQLLEEEGCQLKEERGARVFPVSDHASDVTFALERRMKRLGVKIMLRTEVVDLIIQEDSETEISDSSKGDKPTRRIKGVILSDKKKLYGDGVIVTTGGFSYQTTGSNGDGYRFARNLGLKVVDPRPSLVPFETKESWCKDLMGLALKNVSLRLVDGKKCLYEGFGEMLFTHFGISGPLVLTASCFYGKRKTEDILCQIDLKPALDFDTLDKRVLRDFDAAKNKTFSNSIGGLLPGKLIPVVISLSGIDPEKRVNEITREERESFVRLLKCLPLHITGTRDFNEAIITQGGISVKEINPSTMECKSVAGLYFAGEVLDLDAQTGGFNLQIAWSTGHLAGESAAQS